MIRSRPLLDAMAHPLAVGSVVLLVLNDHLLKSAWPSWATGKLSDFAGLVFFPILIGALIETVTPTHVIKPRVILAASITLTGVTFIGLQLSPMLGDGYQRVMGLIQWPFRLISDPRAQMTGVALTPDPTDLIALASLLVAWRVGGRDSRLAEPTNEKGIQRWRSTDLLRVVPATEKPVHDLVVKETWAPFRSDCRGPE